MTVVDPSRTVGSLVLEHHAAARVFERFDLDYCCGGKRSLSESCASAGVRLDEVVRALEAEIKPDSGGTTDWESMRMDALAAAIEAAHHDFTRESLDHLVPLAEKVFRVHGDRHPELAEVRRLIHALAADLIPHLEKEERVLFPVIESIAQGKPSPFASMLRGPIAVMRAEHESVGKLLHELRAVTSSYAPPADACTSYRVLYGGLAAFAADVHTHVHLENNVLFPKVEATLNAN